VPTQANSLGPTTSITMNDFVQISPLFDPSMKNTKSTRFSFWVIVIIAIIVVVLLAFFFFSGFMTLIPSRHYPNRLFVNNRWRQSTLAQPGAPNLGWQGSAEAQPGAPNLGWQGSAEAQPGAPNL